MRHHLGVCFRGEIGAMLFQLRAQFAEILDNAVVDDCNIVRCMGMSIMLGRLAMGSPARVPNPGMA
ncbi:hypothetical protein ACVWZR_001916 [Bradyrhizobium sp. i1.3.1]